MHYPAVRPEAWWPSGYLEFWEHITLHPCLSNVISSSIISRNFAGRDVSFVVEIDAPADSRSKPCLHEKAFNKVLAVGIDKRPQGVLCFSGCERLFVAGLIARLTYVKYLCSQRLEQP